MAICCKLSEVQSPRYRHTLWVKQHPRPLIFREATEEDLT
jgi:hypothetical protein